MQCSSADLMKEPDPQQKNGLRWASDLEKFALSFFFFFLIKFFFDLPLLEHHNIPPFGVNALNGESIIRYPLSYERTEWKKSNETCDGY